MKRIFYTLFIAATALGFVACNDDDDSLEIIIEPTETHGVGAFILNQGNYYSQIEGSLYYYNYTTDLMYRNVFQKTNGQSLGSTPQTGVVYGSRVYLGIYESNLIWVINRENYKVEKQISLADQTCQMPRSLVANGGNVYICGYNGYVARLDTLSLEIDATVQVGPNPDVMAIRNGYLYVPNSDGLNYEVGYGTTASKINLSTFKVDKTFNVGLNPTKFVSNGSDLFLLCMGDYYLTPATVYQLDSNDNCTEVCTGTLIDCDRNYLYCINAPYGAESYEYKKLALPSLATSEMVEQPVDEPAALAVDPIEGTILISSYNLNYGYADYIADGYLNVYDNSGKFIKKMDVGVGPCAIFFNTETK